MATKLYSLFDENKVIYFCQFFEEGTQPENATLLMATGQNKPVVDLDNNIVFEGATAEEIAESKKVLIEEIDRYYTSIISDLMRKFMEKLIIDDVPIPEYILNERNRLRSECNQKISELGVNVEEYRKLKR